MSSFRGSKGERWREFVRPCSCGSLDSSFLEDIAPLPSVPTSLGKAEPGYCISSSLHICVPSRTSLQDQKGSSLWPVVRSFTITTPAFFGFTAPLQIRRWPFMWGWRCVQTKAGLGKWSRTKLKAQLASGRHLGKVQPAPPQCLHCSCSSALTLLACREPPRPLTVQLPVVDDMGEQKCLEDISSAQRRQ